MSTKVRCFVCNREFQFINKALELAKEVYIFWLDTEKLIKITEPIKLITLDV